MLLSKRYAIPVNAQNLSRWERGQSAPGAPALAKLATYYGTTADWLLGLTDESPPSRPAESTRQRDRRRPATVEDRIADLERRVADLERGA